MINKVDKNESRKARHRRVRNKISGTADKPRLNVFRSLKHIYAQIIDDEAGVTLVSASTLSPDIRKEVEGKTKKEAARIVGLAVGRKALAKGIERVVFDRGGYVYMGRVQQLADGAREAGLKF
ncbi:MAG: 50S ribosomal protein L18 [Christensenellaceae bacterium]|nr:50S ribosomal protein L18 [Christensenellaceae bacterium]